MLDGVYFVDAPGTERRAVDPLREEPLPFREKPSPLCPFVLIFMGVVKLFVVCFG